MIANENAVALRNNMGLIQPMRLLLVASESDDDNTLLATISLYYAATSLSL